MKQLYFTDSSNVGLRRFVERHEQFDAWAFWERVEDVKNPREYVALWDEFRKVTAGRKLNEKEDAIKAYLKPKAEKEKLEWVYES